MSSLIKFVRYVGLKSWHKKLYNYKNFKIRDQLLSAKFTGLLGESKSVKFNYHLDSTNAFRKDRQKTQVLFLTFEKHTNKKIFKFLISAFHPMIFKTS